MKTIVLACHRIGCAGIKALIRNGFRIEAVFTHKDDPGENTGFDSVSELAASHGIPVFAPVDINHAACVKKIAAMRPDILFSFDYRTLIGKDILDIPQRGCLNLHASLLPRYRGWRPINAVLINGESETGVTLHYMTPRPNDGDIVAQKRVTISDTDTAGTLYDKIAHAAEGLLEETLPRIRNNTATAIPQDPTIATYFGGPEDERIDWSKTAAEVRNLVRAFTRPWPGAYSRLGDQKCIFWAVSHVPYYRPGVAPGTVLSTEPLTVACGRDAVRVDFAQSPAGLYISGQQFAREMNLVQGVRFGPAAGRPGTPQPRKRVLIIGVNGFIGRALSERLLQGGQYEVHGIDMQSDYVEHLTGRPGFHFQEGDINIHREWIEYHIRKCDVIIPLIAPAPVENLNNPIRAFEQDFEDNLRIVRYCVKHRKRLVFPSVPEVYGMCEESEFDEDNSRLVVGPICMQHWTHSCCRQLLDRLIWAYGRKDGLQFTLFRPFNWIGPRLDRLDSARIGSCRLITQLILNLVEGTPTLLIDGGGQKRCFTDVADGVEGLFRIIENKDGLCDGKIINLGSPDNEISIRQLAEMLREAFEQHPLRDRFAPPAGILEVESGTCCGGGCQEIPSCRPSVRNARRYLDWTPVVPLEQSVRQTVDYFLRQWLKAPQPSLLKAKPASLHDIVSAAFPSEPQLMGVNTNGSPSQE